MTNTTNQTYFSPTELDHESFVDLLPEFFEEQLEDLKNISHAVKTNNMNNVRQIVHKIKGTAASYGADYLFFSAKKIQDDYNESGTLNEDSVIKLGDALRETMQYAREFYKIDV